jgi:hypothetical protein
MAEIPSIKYDHKSRIIDFTLQNAKAYLYQICPKYFFSWRTASEILYPSTCV